jgi:hypothetical protein
LLIAIIVAVILLVSLGISAFVFGWLPGQHRCEACGKRCKTTFWFDEEEMKGLLPSDASITKMVVLRYTSIMPGNARIVKSLMGVYLRHCTRRA